MSWSRVFTQISQLPCVRSRTDGTVALTRRSHRRAAFGIVMVVTLAGALAACTADAPPAGDPPATSKRNEPPAQEQEAAALPELHPDGTAEENLPYFTETLRQFSAGESAVEGVPVVNAVAAAGFDKQQMQVSFDQSKTDLVADNIFVSVRIGSDCLIAQIVVADRTFTTAVEPAVGPDKNVCLIGNTRPIDW